MLKHKDELGPLANPECFRDPINLNNVSTQWALSSYRMMVLIRKTEEAIANLFEEKKTRTPIHLGIGQEAVAVGVSSVLSKNDKVYSNHRGHSHYLALSGSVKALLAEVLGKSTGASLGMGGSMHLYAPEVGFHGSVPIVGATIPIAVGAALACKMDQKGHVAVCYFGDGACEEGVLHEAMNLASIMRLPILFVCENNLYSSHLDIHLRQPSNKVSRFAEAHNIPARVIDGNDVVEVSEAAQSLLENARIGQGPGFIEAVTFRWRGHVGPNADIDVGIQRSSQQLSAWMMRDPIKRLADRLISARGQDAATLAEIENEVDMIIKEAIVFAEHSEAPNPKNLMDFVYKESHHA